MTVLRIVLRFKKIKREREEAKVQNLKAFIAINIDSTLLITITVFECSRVSHRKAKAKTKLVANYAFQHLSK